MIPADFTGTHPISFLFDYTSSFFSRSVKPLGPPYSPKHGVTVYAIHNPQPNYVCHYSEPNKSVGDFWSGGTIAPR
jgi:hypothetical protein